MTNILLDNIIFSLQKTGGISIVWANLIRTLMDTGTDFRCIEYGCPENIHRTQLNIPQNNIIEKSDYGLILKRYLSQKTSTDIPTIFHSSYYRIVKSPLVKNVTTVHDFTYEYFTNGPRAWIHKWQKFKAIRHSDKIVCISENTRKDLLKFLPETSPSKVSVIYNGVSEDYHPISLVKSELSDFLMFVGARGGYKNFDFAVEIAAQSKKKLLICGAPLNDAETKLLASRLGNSGFISHIRPSNKELNEYYNSVFALIYPSSYEGFGIPVLEAQRAGCPVLALNASSIPEIIGSDYPMLNQMSTADAIKILHRFDQSSFREDIIRHGIENANQYSWDKMGKEYIKLYNSMI